MYAAKELKAGAVVFEPAGARHRARPAHRARRPAPRAGADDELFLHYQPKYTLDGERIEGVEALLRWQHPTRGLIPPGDFIPVAEGTGIILRLTERVLGIALAQCAAWLDAGHARPGRGQPLHALPARRRPARPGRSGCSPSTACPPRCCGWRSPRAPSWATPPAAWSVLQRLHDLGVRLSIDDFGTGYSSMAYLRRLPVDELKIDRSFVLGMTDDAADAVLVRTAIDLGHNLGLTVVAEGVEELGARSRAARPRLRHRAGLPLRPADAGGRADRAARALGPGGRRAQLSARRAAPTGRPPRGCAPQRTRRTPARRRRRQQHARPQPQSPSRG